MNQVIKEIIFSLFENDIVSKPYIFLCMSMISGCSTVMPINYEVQFDESCALMIEDFRLEQDVIDLKVDYPTIFGEPPVIHQKTNPNISQILRAELCSDNVLSDKNLVIKLNKVSCDVDAGFTRTSAKFEIDLLYEVKNKGSQRTYLTDKVLIGEDTGAYPVCEKAMKQLLPQVVEDIKQKI